MATTMVKKCRTCGYASTADLSDDKMRAEAERLIKRLEIRGMAEEAQEIRDMTSKQKEVIIANKYAVIQT